MITRMIKLNICSKKFIDEMIMKKIIFLKHTNSNQNNKILGFFYAYDIDNVINYYSKLPGFSSNQKGFDTSKSICSDNDFVFLLQVWNEDNDEQVFLEELFTNEEDANMYLKKYSIENDMTKKAFQIEKYTINKKYWIDGYVTC